MKPRGGGRERAAGGRAHPAPRDPEPREQPSPGLPSPTPPNSNLTAPPGARPPERLQSAALHRGLGPVKAARPGPGLSREAGSEAGARVSHLGVVVQMVPAHVGRRADTEGSEAARGKRRGRSGRPEQADGVSREDEPTATTAAGPRLPGQLRRRRQRRRR